MPREFKYRGYTLSQLQQISMDEFIKILPSKYRRKLVRGLPPDHRKLLEEIREARKETGTKQKSIPKTHCRDMVIMPEMVGKTIAIHNGREFLNVTIRPEMIGHLLGEFSITNKRVQHGNPGIGASRSSMYVPLK